MSFDNELEATSESGTATQAVTTLTISGKITANGVAVPGATVTQAGKANATTITDATGKYRFSGLSAGSYSLKPSKNGCALTPDVANLNNLSASKTQNFAGSGSACTQAAAPTKALPLVDSRLYTLLKTELDQYRAAASTRR